MLFGQRAEAAESPSSHWNVWLHFLAKLIKLKGADVWLYPELRPLYLSCNKGKCNSSCLGISIKVNSVSQWAVKEEITAVNPDFSPFSSEADSTHTQVTLQHSLIFWWVFIRVFYSIYLLTQLLKLNTAKLINQTLKPTSHRTASCLVSPSFKKPLFLLHCCKVPVLLFYIGRCTCT